MTYLLPLLLGIGHGLSDASAGLLVGLIIRQRAQDMNAQILLYNLVAFGLQPLAGMLFDRIRQPKHGAAVGLLITVTGLLITPLNLNIAIMLIGIGSACLHAGGGSVAITSTPGKASAAGVFAAFGVIGLTIGGMASINYSDIAENILILLLIILATIIWVVPHVSSELVERTSSPMPVSLLIIFFLVIAIALRSTVWVGTQIRVERYTSAALWLAIAAGTGKLVGGFAADRWGWKRWGLVVLAGAGVLLVFSDFSLPALMVGALLLQSVTPLSIAAVGRSLPKSPALAASLALGTAIIAGGLPFFFLKSGWFEPVILAITLLISTLLYWYVLKKPGLEHSTQR
ncbi:MAG: hypothetical protein NTW32_06305 [Chloroflexi bacterium]|nr:hypothetical protein [Chloroflexota bacterium]